MHTMSFRVPAGLAGPVADDLLRSSIAGGHDRAPTATQCAIQDGHLTLSREINESGPVYVPWEVPRAGRLVTPTTTLMFRERPYDLLVELARGKLNQVRNQYAEWTGGGLEPANDVDSLLKQATHAFGLALLDSPSAAADDSANEALALAFQAADVLVAKYHEQVFRVRHQRQPKLDTTFGCRVTAAPAPGLDEAFRLSFNAACIPMTWRSIEPTEAGYQWADADAAVAWALERNLRVCAGPLIDFSRAGLPDFVRRLSGDAVALKSLMCDYVETVVNRYRGKVTQWLITAGANGSMTLGVAEDDLIRLTAIAADAAWQIDSSFQLSFGVSSPWGDYLNDSTFQYSPFVYADTLLRAGLPFSGIELEWFMGSTPRGTYCRDALEASRLLDLFGLLGVPVHVSLSYPSATGEDDRAQDDEWADEAGHWRGFSLQAQADWADTFGSLAACKTFVSGVYWNHLSDAEPHRFPYGGLVGAQGEIKPVFDRLRALRDSHFK